MDDFGDSEENERWWMGMLQRKARIRVFGHWFGPDLRSRYSNSPWNTMDNTTVETWVAMILTAGPSKSYGILRRTCHIIIIWIRDAFQSNSDRHKIHKSQFRDHRDKNYTKRNRCPVFHCAEPQPKVSHQPWCCCYRLNALFLFHAYACFLLRHDQYQRYFVCRRRHRHQFYDQDDDCVVCRLSRRHVFLLRVVSFSILVIHRFAIEMPDWMLEDQIMWVVFLVVYYSVRWVSSLPRLWLLCGDRTTVIMDVCVSWKRIRIVHLHDCLVLVCVLLHLIPRELLLLLFPPVPVSRAYDDGVSFPPGWRLVVVVVVFFVYIVA